MKLGTAALAISSLTHISRQRRLFKFANAHTEKQARLAAKEYRRFNLITLLIIFCAMLPLCVCAVLQASFTANKTAYPAGATQEKRGHISRYEDTFWYTGSSQKYEFAFADYGIDDSYEPGEIISIYLNDAGQVVAVAHQKNAAASLALPLLATFVIPIALLLAHAFIGRKTYAKNFTLYCQWYEQEIEPLRYHKDFEKLVAGKQYYDVTVHYKDLSAEKQKQYRKYKIRSLVYSLLFLLCIALNIFVCIAFDITPRSWPVVAAIVIYAALFCGLLNDCDAEMHRIKTGYYDRRGC